MVKCRLALNRAQLCLQLLLILSIACAPGHGKGAPRVRAPGGGGRASSKNRARYGSSGSSGYSSLPLLIRSRFSFWAKAMAYRMGVIFASRSWRASHPDYSDSMTLCYNVEETVPPHYMDSVVLPWEYQNRTVFGLYICPIDSHLDKLYCCGPNYRQSCCTFWDDLSRFSSLASGASLAFLSSLLFAAWFFRWSRRYFRWKNQVQSHMELHSEAGSPDVNASTDAGAAVSGKKFHRKRPKLMKGLRHHGSKPLSYYWEAGHGQAI